MAYLANRVFFLVLPDSRSWNSPYFIWFSIVKELMWKMQIFSDGRQTQYCFKRIIRCNAVTFGELNRKGDREVGRASHSNARKRNKRSSPACFLTVYQVFFFSLRQLLCRFFLLSVTETTVVTCPCTNPVRSKKASSAVSEAPSSEGDWQNNTVLG